MKNGLNYQSTKIYAHFLRGTLKYFSPENTFLAENCNIFHIFIAEHVAFISLVSTVFNRFAVFMDF
jgi:hypothetical protein